jgi:3-oxoacyl-(acyl-carrier-protein) synthase
MRRNIGIRAWGSVSALGTDREVIQNAYRNQNTYLQQDEATGDWVGKLPDIPVPSGTLYQRSRFAEQIDRSVLLTLLAADQFRESLDQQEDLITGINIGSSRGATQLWEQHFERFRADRSDLLSPLTSPTTTLGNISSWLGAYLSLDGPSMSHSVTCSTALQAIANGVVWLESGRCQRFLAGGSEAPLTSFTLAQMKALRIYALPEEVEFPCRSLDQHAKTNTMVLGEGAAIFLLEAEPRQPLAWIRGIGFAQEIPDTPTSVSSQGDAIGRAMRRALQEYGKDRVDVVVCHAPGTRRGDAAELYAIQSVFGKQLPLLTGNKWKLGHTLGASGALSLEMALLMLLEQEVYPIPFLPAATPLERPLESVMINAMGFGGNAISLIVER